MINNLIERYPQLANIKGDIEKATDMSPDLGFDAGIMFE